MPLHERLKAGRGMSKPQLMFVAEENQALLKEAKLWVLKPLGEESLVVKKEKNLVVRLLMVNEQQGLVERLISRQKRWQSWLQLLLCEIFETPSSTLSKIGQWQGCCVKREVNVTNTLYANPKNPQPPRQREGVVDILWE